ncbi:hypothetical protein K439DRAFT_1627538 [Ramaria rubella]|nr:hypothetical protein K439DRAFT_1627538 [Ramaria rubella]
MQESVPTKARILNNNNNNNNTLPQNALFFSLRELWLTPGSHSMLDSRVPIVQSPTPDGSEYPVQGGEWARSNRTRMGDRRKSGCGGGVRLGLGVGVDSGSSIWDRPVWTILVLHRHREEPRESAEVIYDLDSEQAPNALWGRGQANLTVNVSH